jgi:hypothetical protein
MNVWHSESATNALVATNRSFRPIVPNTPIWDSYTSAESVSITGMPNRKATLPLQHSLCSLLRSRCQRHFHIQGCPVGNKVSIAPQTPTTVRGSRLRRSRRMTWLATIGSVSPFVGLFGTVMGVVDASPLSCGSCASGRSGLIYPDLCLNRFAQS